MEKTKDGHFFLDINPVYFEQILDYLRHGEIVTKDPEILRGVKTLATNFGLTEMLKELVAEEENQDDSMVTMSFFRYGSKDEADRYGSNFQRDPCK